MFKVDGEFAAQADIALSLPVFSSDGMTASNNPCDANFKLPAFKTSGLVIIGTGTNARIVMPAFSVDSRTTAAANLALPVFSSDSKGAAGNIARSNIVLPRMLPKGNIITSPLMSGDLSMPRFGLSNSLTWVLGG
ncbi:MAG: hypothetical protein HQK98_10865 [Nitrospirae bacterium]|nr:hypothetical protein [Nitrospirota bacterium]